MSAARPSTLPEEPASGSDVVDERQGVNSAFAEPAELDEALGERPADRVRGVRNHNKHGADSVGPQGQSVRSRATAYASSSNSSAENGRSRRSKALGCS